MRYLKEIFPYIFSIIFSIIFPYICISIMTGMSFDIRTWTFDVTILYEIFVTIFVIISFNFQMNH